MLLTPSSAAIIRLCQCRPASRVLREGRIAERPIDHAGFFASVNLEVYLRCPEKTAEIPRFFTDAGDHAS